MDVTRAEAIMSVQDLLISEFGEDLRTDDGDSVLLLRDNVSEYDDAWLVPFNTRRYLEGGPPPTGLLPSAALVPKDRRIPPHYPPTFLPVEEYLAKVRTGEMTWSSPPPDTVTYYAKISETSPRSNPKGLLRRCRVDGRLVDERFVRTLEWETTDFFQLQRLGHNDDDYVEISKAEADAFIQKVREHVRPLSE